MTKGFKYPNNPPKIKHEHEWVLANYSTVKEIGELLQSPRSTWLCECGKVKHHEYSVFKPLKKNKKGKDD